MRLCMPLCHIHDQLLDNPSSSVAWVTVSQNCRTLKLLDNIANALGLGSLDEKDERKRAAVLASVLRKKKNFVLILDDIWDPIKLDEVGIPANEIGSKLIITTRSLDVCRMMNCKEIIKVEPLSQKVAWELFQMHLAHNSILPSQIEEIAKSFVNEFSGLPLGIILGAGCLRGVVDICQWNDALERMKNPSLGQDELEFGKLFQTTIYREELIQHFIDEKLIHGMNTRRAELNRGHTILNKLENSCLLEGGENGIGRKYVKMHDVVRDMAIRIASMNSPRFLVGVEATDKLEDEKLMEDTVRMSLIIDFGPDLTSPRCASLSTMLCFNVLSSGIPDCFFTHMSRLTILDLSNSLIAKLPTSVYYLQCLTSLVLRYCPLVAYMPSLENLKALRRLDLFRTGVRELPQGIDTLTNLRYLDLTCHIKVIPDGILCKLSNLQYLVLCTEAFPIRAEEIASLRKLETLRRSYRDLNEYSAFVISGKDGGPTDYSLAVTNYIIFDKGYRDDFVSGNVVSLNEIDESASIGGDRSVVLPNHIETLGIEMPENVDVVTIFCDQRAFDLRKLVIKNSSSMKHLLPCSCFSVPALQSLESLYLDDLENLSDLVEVKRSASSALHTATFSCLKEIVIWECHGMERLFTLAVLHNLQKLEVLGVVDCYKMVEIIESSDELDPQETSSSIPSAFPNLRRLELRDLQELKIFCSNTKMDFPSLYYIAIDICPKLKLSPLLPLGSSKDVADEEMETDEEMRFPPLPPFGSSKDVAGSTSTISLEGIEIDEQERAKWFHQLKKQVFYDLLQFPRPPASLVKVAGMEFLENLAGQFTESLDEMWNKLKRKMEHLVSKEHDTKFELEYAERLSMKKPKKEVENWLQEVARIKTEVQDSDLEAQVKEKSILKHLTLRNSIDRCTTEVNQLIQRGAFHGGLTFQVCDSGVPLVTTELVGENFQENKAMIWKMLMNDNISSVGVYDDMWEYIRLHEVGIPVNEIGCKLIITTRSLDVCRKMDCQEKIKVERLSKTDAWELFQMHLGHNATLPSEIEEIAKSLVNEFAGSKFREDELEFDKLFQVLKYSFDNLNPTLQQCFLYCVLYPEDSTIYTDDLIQHFIDEKLIYEMNTRRAELNRGRTILNKLENSCLLERGDRFGRRYVKMHDVVRDMAIKIASMNSPRLLVGVEATDKLEDDKLMEDIVRMSLLVSNFCPERTYLSPRCASLSTMLCFNVLSSSIPDCFFTHMNRLTILDLSNSSIEKLPTSVYNLQCLTSLVLKDCCNLRYMSSLENLKALRRLDLCNTGIIELPQGIDTLTNLRYLNLKCPIKVIPDGILCKLSRLQYLALDHRKTFPIRGEEIASFRKLETLKSSFRDLNDFNTCVDSWKDGGPTDYSLAVRNDCFFNEQMEYDYKTIGNSVYLNYDDDASVSRGGERSLMLPNRIKSLEIEKLDNVDVVTSFCDRRAFDLRKLVIRSCGSIKQLLPCSCFSVPAFQSLKSLYLNYLPNLSDLIEAERSALSALHTATFSCLKEIEIYYCHDIKRLFTPGLLYNLQNLEYLEVGKCYQMVEIIEPSGEVDAQEASSSISSTLPKLCHMLLYGLPELKIFCSNTRMGFRSLKHIYIEDCPKLRRFPPLPPLPSSKEAADSTSIISLEGI
ncbi:hypothetical protein FNV43_RR21059 [Rhamnella rubrinervis]|uniref:NB-ARC domain-containing protein n=1 Tax=Rhamnella rubrinervis TaxID=2594499 RepID=A0A8K0GR27_9ROSA|nr:hypothetical protein FNV43_RR21059 [Rhamnella rubrinervis]